MESSNNILESLPEDQQLQVYELMGIAGIEDGNVAAKLYIESNHDINRAVQRYFDRQAGGMHEEPAFTQEHHNPAMTQNQQARPQRAQESEVQTQYRRHLQKKQREEEEKGLGDSIKTGVTSVMSGFKNIWNSFVPIAIRGETEGGEQFMSYFSRDHSDLVKNVKFNTGTFEENVEEATKMKRPLLVYLHVDGAAFKTVPNVFKNKKLVDFMNSKFRLLGILMNTEESQKITKYVETKDCPCLAVFRVNLLDETNLVEFIPLTGETNADQVLERLQNIERSYFMILADEEKVKQDTKKSITQQQIRNLQMNSPFIFAGANQEDFPPGQMFSFFGGVQQQQQQRPQISQEEQARLEEARILRQIQEEEFKEVERKILEQQTKQVEEEKNKKEKEETERIEKQKREEEERIREQQKALHRKVKTESLPEEPEEGAADAILVIFRLPDGNRIERRFRTTDKVQSLYDFVDTKEIEFDSSTVRYDLMQPRPFLCLEEKEKSIGEYFEGSNNEVIHIRELTA